MITLPNGFVFSSYLSDYLVLSAPFFAMAFVFAAHKVIKRCLGSYRG